MIWQHAGSLLRSMPCPRQNIIRGASQLTIPLWPLAPIALTALLSLRRLLPRLVAILRLRALLLWQKLRRSADELSMASGTPWNSSGSATRNRTGASQPGGGTGTELYGKLSRLGVLSLAHQNGQDVALWVPRLLLLSPLLHLRHLVLLSLGQCHPVVLQSTPKARRLIPHLAVGMSLWCNS